MTGAYRRAAGPIASFIAMGAFWGAWAALVPQVQQRTGISLPELGAALLWAGVGALPAMLLTGRLWVRLGWRLIPITLVGFGLAVLIPAVAPDALTLAIGIGLVGASSGALDVAMNAAVSDVEAETGRRLMYPAHALFSLAVFVAAVVAGLLRDGGVTALTILGPISAAMLGLAVLTLLDARRRPPRQSDADAPSSRVALTRKLALLGIMCAAAFLIEDALTSWSALHLERTLGARPAIGGAAAGMFAGAMFLGRSAGQMAGRRFSDRALLVGSGIVTAAGILIAAFAPLAVIALAGLFIAGAGVALAAPALFARAGRESGPASRGAAVASLTVFGYMGFVVGPPSVGFIAGAFDLRIAFACLAGLALLIAILAAAALRPRRARLDAVNGPPVARA